MVLDDANDVKHTQLVTIFSAPNYCGEFDNAGGCLRVSENLQCSFTIIPVSASSQLNCQLRIILHNSVYIKISQNSVYCITDVPSLCNIAASEVGRGQTEMSTLLAMIVH